MFDAMVAPVRPRRGTARLPPAVALSLSRGRDGTGRDGAERRREERRSGGEPDSTWHRLGYRGGDTGNGERQGTGTGSGRGRKSREQRAPGAPGMGVLGRPGCGGAGSIPGYEGPGSTGNWEHRAPGTQGDLGMGESGTGEIPPGCQGGEPAPARVGGSCSGAGRVHPEAGGDAEQPPLGARGFGVCSAACWRSSPAAAPTLSSPWLRACLDLGTPAGLCSHLCWRLSSGQSFAAFPG